MKSIIAITFLMALSAVVQCMPDPEMHKHIDECTKEHSVTPQEFKDFNDGKIGAPSENIKCAAHCIMTKQGVMDKAGNFKADVAKAKKPGDAKFSAAVDMCKGQQGSSPCDTAFKINQCLIDHKQMYIHM